MARFGTGVVLVVVGVAACSGGGKRGPMTRQEMIAADPLPLARGAKWTYEVTVKKFDPDADKETTKYWTPEKPLCVRARRSPQGAVVGYLK